MVFDTTIYDNSTGNFKNIVIHFYGDHLRIEGYFFRGTTLKGNVEFKCLMLNGKNCNVEINKMSGEKIAQVNHTDSFIELDKCKHIKIDEYSSHFVVRFYV